VRARRSPLLNYNIESRLVSGLLRLFMHRVLAALAAVLFQLHAPGRVVLVLGRYVVLVFALGALHGHIYTHDTSLRQSQNFIL
jgi:hypothetical protein